MSLYVLFESALGFSLFSTEEAAGIALDSPSIQVCAPSERPPIFVFYHANVIVAQEAATDLAKFGKVVKLKGFQPFRNLQDALESINAVSEGLLPESLKTFLEANLPKGKGGKKGGVLLGVADHRLGTAISDALGFSCTHTDPIPELVWSLTLAQTRLFMSWLSCVASDCT